jgi:hypothetical protein
MTAARRKAIMKYLKCPIMLLIVAITISALFAIAAGEQSSDPIKVVHEYFEANRNMDWTHAAQYLSPDSLGEFKLKILSLIIRTEEAGQQELVKEFGVPSLAALESLAPLEFYAAAMRRKWSALKDKQAEYLRSAKSTILGTTAIANDKIIVKFKTDVDFEGKSISKTGECLLVKQSIDWKIDIINSSTFTKSIKEK